MRGDARVPQPLTGGCQTVAIGASSARTTNGVGTQTRKVLLSADAGCHYAFVNSSGSATTSDTRLPSGSEHLVRIAPGQYVAVIQDSGAGTGTLWVSEMSD